MPDWPWLRLDHMVIVTYTRRPRDLFRRRFWVRCWACDLAAGPHRWEWEAKARAMFLRTQECDANDGG